MKRRILILAPIVLGLLCTMVIGIQAAKAGDVYDLNSNGIVDMDDIGRVAAAFGSSPGESRWDVASDLDLNGIVDMMDVGLIARQFGQMISSPFVVPEYPIGSILGLIGFFAGLGVFRLKKPSIHYWHF